ncbi:MAG: hypothetical protein JSV07_06775 [Acidimicrobiia bacterium]|jgi:hypothetical protein|nr:MAG: hypothetical protein JSV07_06775 [Acidimicrobiia bacterium]
MKKFVLLAHGPMEHTPEFRDAHMRWWSSMAGNVTDSGNPLFNGRNVSADSSVTEVTGDPVAGYSIIEAESLEDAIALLDGCPMDMWVYEAMPM